MQTFFGVKTSGSHRVFFKGYSWRTIYINVKQRNVDSNSAEQEFEFEFIYVL
jgi:hypothetical protein